MGMARTVPHLLHNIFNKTLEENVCQEVRVLRRLKHSNFHLTYHFVAPGSAHMQAHADWGSFATGFWVQLFIYSKPFELVDTYFIVHRKRPLIFLHWYHHVTVLLFCWHSYAFESATGLFFVGMNYSVHAIMYGYYCLMALRMKPKWMNPFFITVAQISQMIVGVSVW